MRISIVLAALLALWPFGARAQDFKGLDLSDEPKSDEKKDEKKEEEKPPAASAAPPVAAAPAQAAAAPAQPEGRLTELEIAHEDRIKSVQRKAFLKRSRLELTPMGFVTLNDALFPKSGPAVRLAFYFADSLGLALRYNYYRLINTDEVRLAKRELMSTLPSVQPEHSVALDLLWSPIYGKVALFNSIRTFDFYLVGGVDGIWSESSGDSASQKGDGMHLGVHLGIGHRFTVLDFLAIDLSFVDTIYSDRPGEGSKSVLQHMLGFNFGLGFFLPLGFDYKEP